MLAAVELFPIRHICGFGRELPDGVVPLNELYAQSSIDFVPGPARPGAAADHVAVLTFDVTADAVVPLARSHAQLIGGALAPFLEADLAPDVALHGEAALVDVAAFGEIGLLASRRGEGGMPTPIPCGPIGAPRGAAGAVTVAETARSKTGTLALRGPMVPAQAFPPGAEQGNALAPDPASFVDTGFPCRRDGDALTITGPPVGITAVGGYRFRKVTLEAQVAAINPAATILAVPDGTVGERLAGAAADPQTMHAALQAGGANPLISGAFRRHGDADAA
jgi:hypothetical protein